MEPKITRNIFPWPRDSRYVIWTKAYLFVFKNFDDDDIVTTNVNKHSKYRRRFSYTHIRKSRMTTRDYPLRGQNGNTRLPAIIQVWRTFPWTLVPMCPLILTHIGIFVMYGFEIRAAVVKIGQTSDKAAEVWWTAGVEYAIHSRNLKTVIVLILVLH